MNETEHEMQDSRELALRYGVTGSPTVLFFKSGKEIGGRLSGFMTKPQVRKAIEEILGDVIPPSPEETDSARLRLSWMKPVKMIKSQY